MANYQEARTKLTNTQLSKLKSAVNNKAETKLRSNKKNVEDEELPHELFLRTRQTTKLGNAFANNMSTDIKPSKVQISKIIQSGGSFGSWLANFGKKVLTNIAIPWIETIYLDLTSNAINKFEKKINGEGAFRAGKRFALFLMNI